MNVIVGRDGAIAVARVTGDVDMATTSALTSAALGAVAADDVGLVLDLSGVRYLDSAGVQTLFDLARTLGTARRRFGIVVAGSSPVRSVLKIAHVDEVAVIDASLSDCIGSLSGPASGDD